MEEERLQRLQNSAAEGNVDELFSVLAEDPYVLEVIDRIPFVTTPLHTAASWGKIHFAMEILNLKPSFASKRDHLGRSPLHLALEGKKLQEGRSTPDLDLEGKYQELVTWLIKHDSELVRVKAKGLVTPLHYAAEIDDDSNLADFLYVCPSSIRDLTVKCETAVHVAIKNRSFRAFKLLLGWLRRFDKEEILNWEDEDGNNALHTAMSENQTEVVKLLIKYMGVNRKNRQGLTALDIYDSMVQPNPEVEKILLAYKAKRASIRDHIPDPTTNPVTPSHSRIRGKDTLVKYFSGDISFRLKFLKIMGLGSLIINKVPMEVRNVVFVVAVLIATATYQAALSPPGGYWQDDSNLPANNTAISNTTSTIPFSNTTSIFPDEHFAGKMINSRSEFHLLFFVTNSLAFCLSVRTIIIGTIGIRIWGINVPMTLMVFAYFFAVLDTTPFDYGEQVLFACLMLVTTVIPYLLTFFTSFERQLIRYGQQRKLHLGRLDWNNLDLFR